MRNPVDLFMDGQAAFNFDKSDATAIMNEIASDPVEQLLQVEEPKMRERNPFLHGVLHIVGAALRPYEREGLKEGALVGHRIIRTVGTDDGQLPRLSESGSQELQSQLLQIVGQGIVLAWRSAQDPIPAVGDYLRQSVSEGLLRESSLGDTVAHYSIYRLDRDAYVAGAGIVITGLHMALKELYIEQN